MKKLLVTVSVLTALMLGTSASGQTNLQVQYDFERESLTSTIEMFKNDKAGNTYFFVDYIYGLNKEIATTSAPSETYFEIARCFNFWHNSFLKDFSLHVEYDGGLGINPGRVNLQGYGINHSLLAGFDYQFHDKEYKNTLNVKALYKEVIDCNQLVPLQFTLVWGSQDIFGAKGLTFMGFADLWFQDNFFNDSNNDPYKSQTVFLSEPQLWYNIGRFLGAKGLNIGGELELSVNYLDLGFKCRPCVGLKWEF